MSCEHCVVSKPFVVADEDIGGLDVRIDGSDLVVRYYDGHVLCDEEVIRIGFCPKCGAPLPDDGSIARKSTMPPHRVSSPYPDTRLWWESEGKWNMEVISGNARHTKMFYGTHDEAKEALLVFYRDVNEK